MGLAANRNAITQEPLQPDPSEDTIHAVAACIRFIQNWLCNSDNLIIIVLVELINLAYLQNLQFGDVGLKEKPIFHILHYHDNVQAT